MTLTRRYEKPFLASPPPKKAYDHAGHEKSEKHRFWGKESKYRLALPSPSLASVLFPIPHNHQRTNVSLTYIGRYPRLAAFHTANLMPAKRIYDFHPLCALQRRRRETHLKKRFRRLRSPEQLAVVVLLSHIDHLRKNTNKRKKLENFEKSLQLKNSS
ncbi:hypothetical protein V9T40_010315 [Parthenolecanium corni]|uniref:Uncharacterized protein n=1 Tax=Parthenolecanium corni TaxID=536013 RepID=A0AAN9Y1A4_9HEMI